jgi:hypothetical protein
MVGGALHADAPESSLSGADPAAVLPLIETIEKLPSSATGAFVFGSSAKPHGTSLVDNGRVCWAAAARMGSRLTDTLRARLDPKIETGLLEEVIRQCRVKSVPFGEALVESGLLSSAALRDALRQNTAEAILFLSQSMAGLPTWVAHRRQRYDAQFTFSPTELLAGVGAACLPELAEAAQTELDSVLRAGGRGVAFAWVGAQAELFPIVEVHSSQFSVGETVHLGKWAVRMLDTPLMLRAVPRLVSTLGAGGDALVTWLTGGIVYVVVCQHPSSLAHVLGKRARASPDGRSGSYGRSGS